MNLKAVLIFIKKLRLPVVIYIVASLFFLFLFFPFSDLGDLASQFVAKQTKNQVFVQFDNLELQLFPAPGIHLENVFVETPFFQGTSTRELLLTPSITALLSQKPYGAISAEGLLGGNLKVKVSSGTKTEAGEERHKLTINAEKLSLKSIRDLAKLPVAIEGELKLNGVAMADLAFTEQPEADIDLSVENFKLPPATVDTMMGPLTLPDISLGKVSLKGRLSGGRFIIEQGQIGEAKDELSGTIKGNWALTVMQQGAGPNPVLGAYSLDLDLQVKKSFQSKAALFLTLLDNCKTDTADGARYRCKASANSVQAPPSFSVMR